MNSSHPERKCLDIIGINWYPYTSFLDKTENSSVVGLFYNAMVEMMRKHGYCYKIRYTPIDSWGEQLENGSFAGTLGIIERGEADMMFTPSSLSYGRFQKVDFTDAIEVVPHSVLMKYPNMESDLAGFIKPFSFNSWLLVLAGMIFMFGVLAMVFKWSSKLARRTIPGCENAQWSDTSMASFWTLGAVLGQGVSEHRRINKGEMLALTIWLLMGFIIQTVYKSNLKAMLTTQRLPIPFETLDQLIEQKDVEVRANSYSLFHTTIMAAKEGTQFNRLFKKIKKYETDQNQILRETMEGQYVFILVDSGTQGYVHALFSQVGHCTLSVMKEKFFEVSLGMTFPKGSPLKSKMNSVIVGMKEFGIFDHQLATFIFNATKCGMTRGRPSDTIRVLSLKDFYGVFSLLVAGYVLSVLAFISEFLVFKMKK